MKSSIFFCAYRLSLVSNNLAELTWKLLRRVDADTLFGPHHGKEVGYVKASHPPYELYLKTILEKSTNLTELIGFEHEDFFTREFAGSAELDRLLTVSIQRNAATLTGLGVSTSARLANVLSAVLPTMKALKFLALSYSDQVATILKNAQHKLPNLRSFRLVPADRRRPVVTYGMPFQQLMDLLPLKQLHSIDITGIQAPLPDYEFPEDAVNLNDIRIVWPEQFQNDIYPTCSSSAKLTRIMGALISMFGSAERALGARLMIETRSEYFSLLHEYTVFDAAVRSPGALTVDGIDQFLSQVQNSSAIKFRVRHPDIGFEDSALYPLLRYDQFDMIENEGLLHVAANIGRTEACKAMVGALVKKTLKLHNLPESALSYIFHDANKVRCTNILLSSLKRYLTDKKQMATIPWLLEPETMEALHIDVNARDSRGCTALHYAPKALIGTFKSLGFDPSVTSYDGMTPLNYFFRDSFYESTARELVSDYGTSVKLLAPGKSSQLFLRKKICLPISESRSPDRCNPDFSQLLVCISIEDFCEGFHDSVDLYCQMRYDYIQQTLKLYDAVVANAPKSTSAEAATQAMSRLCDKMQKRLKEDSLNHIVTSWSKYVQ
jgi:hypothetical protein